MKETWLNRVALMGLAGFLLGLFGGLTAADHDMYHEMALVREAIATGSIPTVDTFSYVPTVKPVIHHEWGTGALLYLITISSGLGATGLMLTRYLLLAAIIIGCYIHARRQGASIPVFATFGVIISVPLCPPLAAILRAKVFSAFFLTILLLFLQEDRRGKRWWIIVWLPLHVIWLNLHAGFVLGIGLIGLYAIERFIETIVNRESPAVAFGRIKHLAGVAVAMMLLVVINPYGLKYLPYFWNAILLDRTSLITEWQPIWSTSLGKMRFVFVFLLLLSVIIVLYAAFRRKLRNMPHVLFMLVAAWQSAWHSRFLGVYSIVWLCCTPAYLEETRLAELLKDFWMKGKRLLLVIWIIFGTAGLYVAIRDKFWRLDMPSTAAEYEDKGLLIQPYGAVKYLGRENFRGNAMVPFHVGSFVSWKLYPAVKVSIDSRFEAAYPVEWTAKQKDFYKGKDGWRKTLSRYPTDIVLVPRYSPIDELLDQPIETSPGVNAVKWQRVYKDDGFSIFARPDIAERFDVVDNTGKPIVGSFP